MQNILTIYTINLKYFHAITQTHFFLWQPPDTDGSLWYVSLQNLTQSIGQSDLGAEKIEYQKEVKNNRVFVEWN